MNDIDTNINNYSLDDMLNLYKVSYDLNDQDIIILTQTKDKINKLVNIVDDAIITFFNKIYIAIKSIYKYRDLIKIKDINYIYTKDDDNKLIEYIKLIPNLQQFNDENYLINKFITYEEERSNELNKAYEILDTKNTSTSHQIVYDKTPKEYANTYNNPIVSGDINSIKRITKLVNIHIDSCFRDKYYNSNPCSFVYVLTKSFKNVVSMKLASIEIPNAWYLFSHLRKNNVFSIEVNSVDCGCEVFNIVIPDGNYDSDSLVNYLNNKYFYQSDNSSELKYICFSINQFNNKSQFELIECAPSGMTFSLHFNSNDYSNSIMETCGWILGFRLANYLNIEDSVISEGLFDGGGDRYIYLSINDYQYNYNESNVICFDKASMDEYTLAKISLHNGKFSLIVDENDCNPLIKVRQYNGPVNLKKMDIKILDKYGNIVDLNYMDYSFSLELEILYERNNIV